MYIIILKQQKTWFSESWKTHMWHEFVFTYKFWKRMHFYSDKQWYMLTGRMCEICEL